MIYCSNCGTQAADTAAFCPNCGTAFAPPAAASAATPLGSAIPANGPAAPAAFSYTGQTEDAGRRVLAFLIDIVPMLLIGLLHFVPIIGWMVHGLLHALYWLLRDVNGSSPGKAVLGTYVASRDGGASTRGQRILRNVTLAAPGFLGMIPLIGVVLEFFLALALFGLEGLLLLTTGKRLGDRIAGTTVLRR